MAGFEDLIGGAVGLGASALTGGALPPSIAMPLGISLAEMISGGIKQNKAQKMAYPEVDPLQVQFLKDIERKRTMMETGNYFLPQQEQIRQQGRQAQNTIAKLTHGDIGATINGNGVIAYAADEWKYN